jgi:hypothetical protein
MIPVQITIKHAHLEALLRAFDDFSWRTDLTPELKASQELCLEMYKVFYKKEIDKRDSDKWFKINLKYYQAFALWNFTSIAENAFPAISFERTALRIIKNQIHKQL